MSSRVVDRLLRGQRHEWTPLLAVIGKDAAVDGLHAAEATVSLTRPGELDATS
jgi:hypothetical protein